MDKVFLQEVEATIVMFDLRKFNELSATLIPIELATNLTRFYEHVESVVSGSEGRIVKWMGDSVLCAWLGSEDDEHKRHALEVLKEALQKRDAFVKDCEAAGLESLDYSVAIASGPVLVGQIGTTQEKSFDVLGQAVNVADKLTAAASSRKLDHLIAESAIVDGVETTEVDPIDLGGQTHKLYTLK